MGRGLFAEDARCFYCGIRQLIDLVPLCRRHHEELHELPDSDETLCVRDTHDLLPDLSTPPVVFGCPKCSAKLEFSRTAADTLVRCVNCRAKVRVPCNNDDFVDQDSGSA